MTKAVSISDDDLCATCAHCQYNPGELSTCARDAFGDAATGEGNEIESCKVYSEARAFTVILLYPDHVAGSYGETFMSTARVPYDKAEPGDAVKTAVAAVRAEAVGEPDPEDEDTAPNPEDFAVVAVIEGDHNDIGYLA